MFDNLDEFKLEIEEYVKEVYSLILEDYGEFLNQDKLDLINNFDYKNNIKIDKGGKYSICPGRWESKANTLALSPVSFYNTVYKKEMEKDIIKLDINEIQRKLNNSSNETFTGLELANYIKQNNLSVLDITKGIVIHELFHSIITLKDPNEVFRVSYRNKNYDCKGIKGDYLEEGIVEYYARCFANKHNLFLFPSIPYQENIEYAKEIIKQLGMNANKLIFNSNYRTILNYIHKKEEYKKYDSYEAEWLSKRIVRRLETKDIKDIIEADEIEELKLI